MSKRTNYNPNATGAPDCVEGPVRYGFSPSRGYTTVRNWSGTRDGIRAMADSLGGFWSWEIQEGPVCKLTATLGADNEGGSNGETEVPITTWELLPNRVDKDILESSIAPIAALTEEDISEIEKAVEDKEGDYAAARGKVAHEVYLLLKKGIKASIVSQPTLNKSQIVSRSYTAAASSIANVGKIFKTSTLISAELIPSTISGILPNDTSPQDTELFDFYTQPRLRYGWMKNPPTVSQSSYDKFQINQTWDYGLWSVLIYGDSI